MTPAEVIAAALRHLMGDQRATPVRVEQARAILSALAEQGMVVVSAEDLAAIRHELTPEGRIGRTLLNGSYPTAANVARGECLHRLRATLPERTENA